MINHKIHMKADLARCPDESADFEKVVMTLVMRHLNRKYKNNTIASEIKVIDSNDIADIGIKMKDKWVYYELQKEVSPDWVTRIMKRDAEKDCDTLVIHLKPLIKKYGKMINELRNDLKEFMI